jgi:hypothetical protein
MKMKMKMKMKCIISGVMINNYPVCYSALVYDGEILIRRKELNLRDPIGGSFRFKDYLIMMISEPRKRDISPRYISFLSLLSFIVSLFYIPLFFCPC